MKKQLRIVVAAVCAFAMVGAFALTGCSSNGGSTEQKSDSVAEQSADNNKEQVELQVFAANSLSKAMEEVQAAYIADGHDNVSFADTQYKASGELNEMLGAGSCADLLISASKGSMDTAVEKGYVDSSTRVDMFKNDLVMVSKEGADIKDVTLDDIAAGKYSICVGDDSVPAGNYAAQSLSTVGVYTPAACRRGQDRQGHLRQGRQLPGLRRCRPQGGYRHLRGQRVQACPVRRCRRRLRVHLRRVPLRRRADRRHRACKHA